MPESANFRPPFSVMLVGDSITQRADTDVVGGFARLLRAHYLGRVQVVNLGISGGNGMLYEDMVDYSTYHEMPPKELDVAFIMLGTNDCTDSMRDKVTVESFGEYMLRLAQKIGAFAKEIVYVTPPVMVKRKDHDDPNYVDLFVAKIQEIGSEYGYSVLDIRHKIKEGDDILVDGLHYNELGNQYHFELVQEYLDARYRLERWAAPGSEWQYCAEANTELMDDGTCECGAGMYRSARDQACLPCPEGAAAVADRTTCDCSPLGTAMAFNAQTGRCQCSGQLVEAGGVCIPCTSDAVPNEARTACVCRDAMAVFDAALQACVCTEGYSSDGRCVPCPDGLPVSGGGSGCVCANAGEWFASDLGRCVCPANQELRGGSCVPCGSEDYRGIDMGACEALALQGYSAATLAWALPVAFLACLVLSFGALWFALGAQGKRPEAG